MVKFLLLRVELGRIIVEKEMAEGIIKALNGEVHSSSRRTWEDYCEKKIYEMFNLIVR